MRGVSMGLLGLGVVVVLLGLVNHYALKANPVAHFSTIVLVVGAVLAIAGGAMMAMGGRGSAAR